MEIAFIMNIVSNIQNENKSEINKLEKESEKHKIIGGCLIALAIIITGITVALFFILPLWIATVVFLSCLLIVYGLCWGGSSLICGAQETDKEIAFKQLNKASTTFEEEDITLQTRRQKADLSLVDLRKLPGEEESITLEPQEVGESQTKRRQHPSNVDVQRVV